MEPRNTRPGGSVVPVKKSTAPGFPSQKPNQKTSPHGLMAFLLNPEKRRETAADSTDRSPQRTRKNEESKVKKEKRGAVEKA
jgi:hypothetical protein